MKIKKESPNEGTETRLYRIVIRNHIFFIKKESPNEGTETGKPAYKGGTSRHK